MSSTPLKTVIVYPDTDGTPMAESDSARDYLTYSVEALQLYFQERDNVYVSGNLFIYYQQGTPSAVIAPDVFVIFGVEKKPRMSYKVWQENNQLPQFILEITSKTTQIQDEEDKPLKYARLGVREYFQYDPTGDYLNPQLKGYTLVEGKYQGKVLEQGFKIVSEVLGLELHLLDKKLRFFDPKTQKYLPSYQEIELARQQERLIKVISRLQALGLTPEQIATTLNLSVEQINNYLEN
jgi:Uma2 family endonuclease